MPEGRIVHLHSMEPCNQPLSVEEATEVARDRFMEGKPSSVRAIDGALVSYDLIGMQAKARHDLHKERLQRAADYIREQRRPVCEEAPFAS